ncbi:general stress protein CsbD [Lacihabitans soyangensis]|uniref:General stress protein CsbD n=1 Tax=Lacihabitans soyangensis TaxID=869394 RepID=A0AAE3H2Y0_9BACT|nr:general stress protein CsbD [Lacihabitans soyangensis]MCP9763340.1 general stress protein CsbD [Lacihabitans soyangensis]
MTDYSDLKGNWVETSNKLKRLFLVLENVDLTFSNGKQAELWAKIETKVGKSKAEIQGILSGL